MTSKHTTEAGKSSYDLIDQDGFWRKIDLKPGMTVLDLGCGQGRYSLPLAAKLGETGNVIAVDTRAEGIALLRAEAAACEIHNVQAHVADAGRLPLCDQCVDLCLLATVLGDFTAQGAASRVLQEVARVLKPRGTCAVVEFEKRLGPPASPEQVRLSVEDVAVLLQPLGFIRFSAVVELGRHLYLSQFRRLGQPKGFSALE